MNVFFLVALLSMAPTRLQETSQPVAISQAEASDSASHDWPQWRGAEATGASAHAVPPIEWSEEKNVRWKVEVPGKGHSTPVVWGDLVFLTTAVAVGPSFEPRLDQAPGVHDSVPVTQTHEFQALAIRRSDGSILWQSTLAKEIPHEGGHYTASLASNSPATDGKLLFAFFGSRGLHALDYEGKVRWQVDLGKMQTKHAHGEGASPALHGDTLVVNWDHRGQSFVAAFETSTGRERWRVQRNEVTSWATPIMVKSEGRTQVVVSGTERVRAYDLETGKEVWAVGGLSANVVASPVASSEMVFAASSYDTRNLLAIRLHGAKGDVTGTDHVVWSRTRGTPYVPSLLLSRERLYFLRHYQPILTRVIAATGEETDGPFRLGGLRDIYASPVAAAGRVYVTDRRGTTIVLSDDANPRLLALNRLDDSFSASAALSHEDLYLRGERFLYSLSDADKRRQPKAP